MKSTWTHPDPIPPIWTRGPMEPDWKRVSSDSRDKWFPLTTPANLINPGPSTQSREKTYNQFGNWFIENCTGVWAYPASTDLLFSKEEDKIKFILRWM